MTGTNPQPTSNPEPPIAGQRRLFYFNDTGQPAYQSYDLNGDDFLNPQPGDEFFHGEVHDRSIRILAGMLHHHYRYSPTTSVHIRPKLIFPDTSIDQPMPDIVVINHLTEPQRHRPILDLTVEQSAQQITGESAGEVSVRAIFEVTSPLLAEYDLEVKRTLYARANVPEYWIIDSGLRPGHEQTHFTILGFRLEEDRYATIPPVSENR